MRRTTVIAGAAGAAIVLGGGIALAYDGGGTASGAPDRTLAALAPSVPLASPTPPPAPPSSQTRIDPAGAVRIALRTVPDGRVESIEREREHGRVVWDVDVIARGVEHDLDIDAQTGKVLRHRTERDSRAHGHGHHGDHDDHDDHDDGDDDD
ncbi:PepSY domain-containing protein [Actinomadura sp. SCN-SB]|uniref:PepSY domain-containing protein n=1 Tax=Actinomadura sp. SCN-SB TaxID=3373092 RepID=UPI003751D1DC